MAQGLDDLVDEFVLDDIAAEVAMESYDSSWRVANPKLLAALETCRQARSLVSSEQGNLQILVEQSQSDTERKAREYQRDLVAWQLNRASDVAEKRISYLDSITSWRRENERCADDTLHWFEYYAWTVDPRHDSPLAVMPLAPFEFQDRFIKWLEFITFEKRSSGVVEKCRTMGATETALRWMLKQWRYRPNFYAMPLSANEDLVDSKKDLGTLFEKLRFQLRFLPVQMLPAGFSLERDMPFMQLVNAENGSIIQGDAPTVNVGRQRRATFVLKDESASWPNGGYQQHGALSRTANTIVDVSSVQGKFNKFHDIATDNKTEKFEMDWRDHPWYDERWYNALPFGYIGPAMTEQEIAQEIDRSYDASQPGRVLRNVREEYCFITEDELVAAFPGREALFNRDGQFVLPSDWNWGRVSDYGESAQKEDDTHIWAYSLFARPAERWPRWAVDSLFFFISRPIEPIGATELEGFACYSEWERQIGVRGAKGFICAPQVNDMSHETGGEAGPKQVLLVKCGDNWRIPDLDFDKGRRKLVFHFEIIDKHLVNPIRSELMGRTRIYFVAPKGSYQLAYNDRSGSYFVTPSTTQAAFRRLRAEIPAWHYPPEERGKPVPKMRPKAVFDDLVTTMRYAVARWGVSPAEKTLEEKIIDAMPEQSRPENIKARSPLPKGLTPELQMEMEYERARAAQKVKSNRIIYFDENLRPINARPTTR